MNTAQSPHVKLALYAIKHYATTGSLPEVPADTAKELLEERAGVFVSLHKFGELRGCIGTIEPTADTIAEEIVHNALSAAYRDWRFQPVTVDEIPDLECSVDVLGAPEPVEDISQLDPKVYGVIVSSGTQRGLLLPDLEGVDSAEHQVSIAMRKAGISDRSSCDLYRFRVTRYY